MSNKYQIEMHRRIYDNDEGRYITVRPSADFPDGNVMIFVEPSEVEYFGEFRLDLPAGFMRKLALALITAADEAEATCQTA